MRFHMGVSFNLRKLKKYLIPFLIGLLSFLGFSFLHLTIVNAEVQEAKYFNIEPDTRLDYALNNSYFGNITANTLINNLKNLSTTERNLTIFISLNAQSGLIDKMYLYAIPTSNTTNINIYARTSSDFYYLVLSISSDNLSSQGRLWTLNQYYNASQSFLDSNTYSAISSCLSSSTCVTSKPSETNYSGTITQVNSKSFYSSSSYNYISSVSSFDSTQNYDVSNNYIYYYSSSTITFSLNTSNTDYIYRDILVNGDLVSNSTTFPSYLDLDFNNDPDNPDNPDDPVIIDDSVTLKGFAKYVVWFFEPENSSDVLVNIYIGLFLYVISYFTLKFITIIYNTKWR